MIWCSGSVFSLVIFDRDIHQYMAAASSQQRMPHMTIHLQSHLCLAWTRSHDQHQISKACLSNLTFYKWDFRSTFDSTIYRICTKQRILIHNLEDVTVCLTFHMTGFWLADKKIKVWWGDLTNMLIQRIPRNLQEV